MDQRRLARTDLNVSPIGFGAFKIGRNEKIKYPKAYDLPDMDAVAALLEGVLDLGINLIDTAAAYGLSEERIGLAIGHRRSEYVLSTKAGEGFADGRSEYDYTNSGIRRSVQRSLRRLATDHVDILLIHSNGEDMTILNETDAAETVCDLRAAGLARYVGFSGKTVDGARAAMRWADVLMIEHHLDDRSHAPLLSEADEAGVGILVKKGLAAGRLAPAEAIPFILEESAVGSLILGGLNLDHMRANVAIAEGVKLGA